MDWVIKELKPSENKYFESLLDTLNNLTDKVDLKADKVSKHLQEMNNRDAHLFVARDENKVYGAITVFIEQKLIHDGGLVAHIEDVATRKGYEGNGIASKIMNEIISYTKDRGCYKIVLFCKDDLIPFYERFNMKKAENQMRLNL